MTRQDRSAGAMEPDSGQPVVSRDGAPLPSGITSARLGLGRAGSAPPTSAVLAFDMAHALARDAVHDALDRDALASTIGAFGLDIIQVDSAAPDRATYLRRPDFGRRLSRESRSVLAARPRVPADIVLVVADGLSATAAKLNARPLLDALIPLLRINGRSIGSIVLANQGRVALGDEIGALMGARMVVVLIGERPGLSAADSLGAYLTLDPKIGRNDAERNCVSNIRAGGLDPDQAASTLARLIERALTLGMTGVELKDNTARPDDSLPKEVPRLLPS
ncbi:ethanolamine ammonia-lyase subunit EutC [Lichenihabitans psoromatis]|uniref:ethanolamine ammonia-lyase subunit EutC n=1 Tax=Lichenihabitans psoromatis TaxID=2528642 RepID=UPI0010382F6A|nr:ethanolamine ammonia-lyase subunit EutC [Lichenihabitans psoromatis]